MNELKMVRCVLFDYGRVISLPQNKSLADQMAALVGLEPDVFEKIYFEERTLYDKGDLAGCEYWGLLSRRIGIELDETKVTQLIGLDIACWGGLDNRVIELATDLRKAGYETGILSNMPIDQVTAYKTPESWMSVFDHVFLSAEFRMIKPAAEIYEYVMAQTGRKPEEIFFIDDRLENIEAADRMGWQTFLYPSGDAFESLRDRFGFTGF